MRKQSKDTSQREGAASPTIPYRLIFSIDTAALVKAIICKYINYLR